jgi:hypothetical protein
MPAVLVLILCVVHAAIRREGLPAVTASSMTASDLVAAMRIAREVEEARRAVRGDAVPAPVVEPVPEARGEPPPAEPQPEALPKEENVTSLSTARLTK